MLAYLRGTVHSKEVTGGPAERLVLDVSGVGFELVVSPRTLMLCGQPGDQVTIHTSLAIRETDWTIFGFASIHEREMFTLLQSVSGVGPKLALAVVATLSPEQLAAAIIAEDHKLISQAPGVGAKVAQRIILELKSKVEDWQSKRGIAQAVSPQSRTPALEEVRAILEGLGYTAVEINLALQKAEEEQLDSDVELLVRHSLKMLGAVGR